MNADLQKKLLPLFHYVLKPGGILFLGTSEGAGEFAQLFTVLDRKWKLYQRKEDLPGSRRGATSRLPPPQLAIEAAPLRSTGKAVLPEKRPLRELTEQALLQQLAPACALVNGQGDILYLHGRTGMYLEPAPGEAGVNNILKMARQGLRQDLRMALHKTAGSQEIVHCPGLSVQTNSHFTRVDLTVCPLDVDPAAAPELPLYLVILQEAPALVDSGPEQQTALPASVAAVDPPSTARSAPDTRAEAKVEARIAALKQELRAKDEYLQTTQEELETSNEELKSSNEEMQSVNEELQSTNEELETSKEELQSVNEELSTVNTELQNKVFDLSRANNDMNNLLAGTGIGTVFVDHQLRIMRFTPTVSRIINLILSDVGRPVAHIVANLVGYDRLVADTQEVLDTLVIKEIDVQTSEGRWYTLRIQPYRTLDNVIEGAVISFFDITEAVRTRDALRAANDMIQRAFVVRDARDAMTVQDLAGRILAWNPAAQRMYGWSEAEALLLNVRDRIPPQLQDDALTRLEQLSRAEILEPYDTQRLTREGAVVAVSIIATALLDEAGQMYAIATTERAKEAAIGRSGGGC
ncbi:MCP methyltransferase/methylesterase, CheR/CheB with PAS/PAC sensor (fragment) [Candidatus Accumulibacter aalborgensis]|uniref:MCP methyltransferase/methylesterase, CheR/CheB with PAS/PAC sensor n=2 Tax=Candidatus Accumulibacter aalborgensis TaxID=1860102 RepID=A0A1A8XVW9_9PROT